MVLLLVVVLGLGVGTDEHRAARVMHDVVTDAAHQRAPQLALAARADDDHVDVLLLGHLAQRVARLHAALVANVNVVNLAQRIQTMQTSTAPLRMYMLSNGIMRTKQQMSFCTNAAAHTQQTSVARFRLPFHSNYIDTHNLSDNERIFIRFGYHQFVVKTLKNFCR